MVGLVGFGRIGRIWSDSFGFGRIRSDLVGGLLEQYSRGFPTQGVSMTQCPNNAYPDDIIIWLIRLICSIFHSIIFQLPFDDDHIPTLFKKIRSGKFVIPNHVNHLIADLLTRMLHVDSMKRITVDQIK